MFKIKFFGLLICYLMFSSVNAYASQQLANFLGAGSNPKLHLELSANGPGWKTFSIDYQQSGDVPWSTDAAKNWSSWNVKDENNNYYGTISLGSDSKSVTWISYTSGEKYSLKGVNFSYNKEMGAYQLTVDKILNGPLPTGPFIDAPIATPAVYPDTNKKITLSVNGANIVNDKGKIIVLKGVARPSLEWNKQGEKLSEQDIQRMHEWGANVIRISLNQNYWFESAPVTQIGSYKQIINAIVYYAIKNDMAVILDLHWTENGRQSNMANRDSIKFWQEVATDYKDFGTVIFELFNEPVNIDKSVWLNGNATYAGYQELYNAVRNTGANNICIMNGLNWGYDLSFVNDAFKVKGNNIVYGAHPYNDRTNFVANMAGIAGKYPLIMTEFGVNIATYFPTRYKGVYQNILNFANQVNASYTGFGWWVGADNFPALIQDWNGTPVNGGVLIHDDMVAHPGTVISSGP